MAKTRVATYFEKAELEKVDIERGNLSRYKFVHDAVMEIVSGGELGRENGEDRAESSSRKTKRPRKTSRKTSEPPFISERVPTAPRFPPFLNRNA
jgi:hypothetical protein